MEQLRSVVYRFSGLVRREDGSQAEILVEISAPEDSGEGDSTCWMSCPFLEPKPLKLYGIDHQQALDLARRFVEASLEHMNACLIDADGNVIRLPPVPKEI